MFSHLLNIYNGKSSTAVLMTLKQVGVHNKLDKTTSMVNGGTMYLGRIWTLGAAQFLKENGTQLINWSWYIMYFAQMVQFWVLYLKCKVIRYIHIYA